MSLSIKRTVASIVLALVGSCLSAPAWVFADTGVHGRYSAQIIQRQDKGKTMTAAQAAKIAQARHGGKVLSVEREQTSDGVVYKVKLLQDNGRVKTVTIKG